MARWSGLRGLLVACAVLAGLLAMHGLTQHGDHLPAAVTASPATDHPTAVAATHTVAAPRLDPEPGHDLAGSGALAMCLTVLAAACLTMWATARPRGGLLRAPTSALTTLPGPPVRARAPDPPGRWTLSVCRC